MTYNVFTYDLRVHMTTSVLDKIYINRPYFKNEKIIEELYLKNVRGGGGEYMGAEIFLSLLIILIFTHHVLIKSVYKHICEHQHKLTMYFIKSYQKLI